MFIRRPIFRLLVCLVALQLLAACSKQNSNIRTPGTPDLASNTASQTSSSQDYTLVSANDARAPLQLLPDQQEMLKSLLPDSFPIGLNRLLKEYMNHWYAITAKQRSPANLLGSFAWLAGSTKLLLQDHPACVAPESLYNWSKTYDQPAYIICRNPIKNMPDSCSASPYCRTGDAVCLVGCSKTTVEAFPTLTTKRSRSLTLAGELPPPSKYCAAWEWGTANSGGDVQFEVPYCASPIVPPKKQEQYCWVPFGTIPYQEGIPYYEALGQQLDKLGHPASGSLGIGEYGFDEKKGPCTEPGPSSGLVDVSYEQPIPPYSPDVLREDSTSSSEWVINNQDTKNGSKNLSILTGGEFQAQASGSSAGESGNTNALNDEMVKVMPKPNLFCTVVLSCYGKMIEVTGTKNSGGGCDASYACKGGNEGSSGGTDGGASGSTAGSGNTSGSGAGNESSNSGGGSNGQGSGSVSSSASSGDGTTTNGGSGSSTPSAAPCSDQLIRCGGTPAAIVRMPRIRTANDICVVNPVSAALFIASQGSGCMLLPMIKQSLVTPSLSALEVTSTSASLFWTTANNTDFNLSSAAGFTIFRSQEKDNFDSYVAIKNVPKDVNYFTDYSLTPGTTYNYIIRAFIGMTNLSDLSKPVTVTTTNLKLGETPPEQNPKSQPSRQCETTIACSKEVVFQGVAGTISADGICTVSDVDKDSRCKSDAASEMAKDAATAVTAPVPENIGSGASSQPHSCGASLKCTDMVAPIVLLQGVNLDGLCVAKLPDGCTNGHTPEVASDVPAISTDEVMDSGGFWRPVACKVTAPCPSGSLGSVEVNGIGNGKKCFPNPIELKEKCMELNNPVPTKEPTSTTTVQPPGTGSPNGSSSCYCDCMSHCNCDGPIVCDQSCPLQCEQTCASRRTDGDTLCSGSPTNNPLPADTPSPQPNPSPSCGGFLGLPCPLGMVCELPNNHIADAMGTCVQRE